jgi:RimJ/RimL family protein N-acetyltransferase
LGLPIHQLTFPKTEDWHRFAATCGMEPAFFCGPTENHREHPTTCFTLSIKNEVCAVAPLFLHSHECGLWVAPSRRQQGFGRLALSHLIARNQTHLYATVAQGNPHAGAMEHLLRSFGFRHSATARRCRIWARSPKG